MLKLNERRRSALQCQKMSVIKLTINTLPLTNAVYSSMYLIGMDMP